jgi:hypothetical protein
LTYVVLALSYVFDTPVFEKPDEDTHFAYVRYVSQTGALPVQQVGSPAAWAQEGSQPPLYYALAAMVARSFDTSDFERLQAHNPYPSYAPYTPNNKNKLIIHDEKRPFNYRKSTAAAIALRMAGIVTGLITIGCAHVIALTLGVSRKVAGMAGLLIALNPMLLFITTSVSNDGIAIALSSVAVAYLVKLLSRRAITVQQAAICGLLIGLASLAKVSGLLLAPVALASLVFKRASPKTGLALTAAWLTTAGWWYARNLFLYGEITGTTTMAQIAGLAPISLREALGQFEAVRISYLALFGQVNIPINGITQYAFTVLLVVALASTVAATVTARNKLRQSLLQPQPEIVAWSAIVLHGALIFAAMTRWMMMTHASQGRLAFPAICGLSIAFVAALMRVPFAGPMLAYALIAIHACVALTAPLFVIAPAYAVKWDTQQPAGGTTQMLAPFAEISGVGFSPPVLKPGEAVQITIPMRALRRSRDDMTLFVVLFGRDGEVIASAHTYPGDGLYPTSAWTPGARWLETIRIDLPDTIVAPATLRAQISLRHTMTDERASGAQPLWQGSTVLPIQRADSDDRIATFGQALALKRARCTATGVCTLDMSTLRATTPNLSIFVHAVGPDGKVWSIADGPFLSGDYDSGRWGTNVPVTERRVLALPVAAAQDPVALHIGLYDPVTGVRLDAQDATGQPLPNNAAVIADAFKH